MPRARSGIERKYREKARRERKEVEFIHNKMLSEWIKLNHTEMFLQFEKVYDRIRTRNSQGYKRSMSLLIFKVIKGQCHYCF